MINVVRKPARIASLDSPEIRAYIESSVEYLNGKRDEKPGKPTTYRTSDLLEAFDNCFHSKCYLTEKKFTNSWAMDVEHFIPQNERPDLVYDWQNLLPADHKANMMKPRATPPGGYLNPADPGDDVENGIVYSLSALGEDPRFAARNPNCDKSVNTVALLDRLHNGHDPDSKKNTAQLRHAIHKKYIRILNKIIEWQGCEDGSQEKFQAERELKDFLSRRSSFTMLCRSIPAVRQRLPSNFFD